MINFHFFPSKRIAIYMAKTFLLRSLAVLAGLVLVLMALDLLGESGKILAKPGNGDEQLWKYVSLRIPMLISRFLPFSVLLGTLITLATLNQNSEIVSMKAAGISAHQIIAPLILASVGLAGVSFMFNERMVTRAAATLAAWEAVEYGRVPPSTGISSNVWVRGGDDLILVRQVSGRRDGTRLRGLTIYRREGSTLASMIRAESAAPAEGGWRLANAQLFDVEGNAIEKRPSMMALQGVSSDQFTLARVSADEQDFWTLKDSIAELKVAGRPTAALEAALWHKISGPLSALLMPLLAGVAAFGLARSGQLFLRAIIGMGLGFAYFVADNFALAMGDFGAYPPLLAAWGPFALFLLIGETVLIRTEE
jgi:lipopolysaccharide export system permease protein